MIGGNMVIFCMVLCLLKANGYIVPDWIIAASVIALGVKAIVKTFVTIKDE